MTAYNKLCSDNGGIAVDDIETCQEAAKELNGNFKGTEDLANWPKGCYFTGMQAYFNHHSTGSTSESAREICKRGGKE